MLLPRFSYHRPQSLAEAMGVLGEFGEEARVLAGGTDMLVNLKHGKLSPAHVVSLSGIKGMSGVDADKEAVRIGPLTTAAELAESQVVKRSLAPLAAAALALGSPAVRNRATVGGNLCTARPAGDMCVALLALDAGLTLAGPEGERELPISEFFMGPGQTAMAPGEILTSITVAKLGVGQGGGYQKLGLRRALEIAIVNASACLELSPDGRRIKGVRVSLGAVAPTPIRAPKAEELLKGRVASEKNFAAAGEAAAEDAKPIDDFRGSAAYRRDMVAVLVKRALGAAWEDAK